MDEWSSGVWKKLTDPYKKELEKQGVYGVGLQESKEEYERLNKLKTEEILDEWDKKTGDKNKFWNKVNRGLNDAVLDPKGVDNWTGGSLPKVTAKYHLFWTERKLGVGFDQTAAQQSSEKVRQQRKSQPSAANRVSMASANLGAGRTKSPVESLREGIRYHTNESVVEQQRQRADYTRKNLKSSICLLRCNHL